MYCKKCGFKNIDDANYCQKCGIKLTEAANSQQSSSYSGTHPYHKLGGWLGFITYGLLVGVILIVIAAVIGGFGILRYAKYLGFKMVLLGLFEIAIYIPVVYFCIKMHIMIKNKDTSFLRFYEKTMLSLCGISIVLMIIEKVRGFDVSTEEIRSLIQAGIIFAVWLTYFRKSVRVRTYFGSDNYLRKSIFLKNCQAPEPADRN